MTEPRRDRPKIRPVVWRCQRCGRADGSARYDAPTQSWACGPCWFATRPETEPRRDP